MKNDARPSPPEVIRTTGSNRMTRTGDPNDDARTELMRQLFVDLDGVLADFDRHYAEQFGIETDRNAPEPPDFWVPIERHGSFFATMPVMPDAIQMWEGAKRLHPNPVILTGIPRIHNVQAHKLGWVHQHIDPHATVLCCRSKDKRLHGKPGDILVDDWFKYRHLWEEMGGVFILHTSAQDSLERVASVLTSTPVAKGCAGSLPGSASLMSARKA